MKSKEILKEKRKACMCKIVCLFYIIVFLLLFLPALPALSKITQEIETKTPGSYFGFPAENIEDIDLSRQYAFFIGIDNYRNIRDLYNSVNDCKAIEMLLDERYGFNEKNIKSLYNTKATKEAIQAQFKAYVDNLTNDDVLFIYFSGHGYMTDLPFEKVYWLPEDVGTDLNPRENHLNKESEMDNVKIISSSNNKISDSDLKNFMKCCQASHIFIVMDSCYSSVLFENIERELQYVPITGIPNGKSRQLLAARVFDGINEHGPFAAAFISILQREEPGYQYVSASQIISKIKKKFEFRRYYKGETQIPDGGRFFDAGDKEGEFYFYLKYEVIAAQIKAEFEKLKKFVAGDHTDSVKLRMCEYFLDVLDFLPYIVREIKAKEILSMRLAINGFINNIKNNKIP